MKGHEIVLVFEGEMTDKGLYENDNIPILDSKEKGIAVWQNISDFKSGKLILYPDGAHKLLKE